MKKKIVFICIVLALLFFVYPHGVIFVDAAEVVASGACGENLVWELNDEGMLRISGNGAMFNWEGNTLSSAPWYSINDEIKSLVIENGVTSIGNYAFHWCNLMSVILPNSIENIGDSAFKNCCELESIVLQEGVKHIGAETFYGCIKLSDISIPSSVVSMDHNIFEACNALTQIDVSSANPNYCSNNGMLFDKAQTILISYPSATGYVIIPDSVIHIGNTAFYSCEKMTGIAFPDSLLSIGEYAFYSCENLADVKLPDGISTIGDLAFYGCDSISSITIPASITSVLYH